MKNEKPRRDYDATEKKLIAQGREAEAKARWQRRKQPSKTPRQ